MQARLESKRRHFSLSKTGTAMAVPAVPLPPAQGLLFFCSLSYWLLRWLTFLLFFTELTAVGCVQHSFMHLVPQIRTLQRASHAVLPALRRQEMSSRCYRVMHVSDGQKCSMNIQCKCFKLGVSP